MTAVAILGDPNEAEVRRVADALRSLDRAPMIIDTAVFPRQGDLTFVDGHWRYAGGDLRPIRACYVRSLHCHPLAADSADALERTPRAEVSARREKESALRSMLRCMEAAGAAVINPVDTLACHFLKPDTLARWRSAGLPVPDTLVTNDPTAVTEFARRHREIIYKPLAGGAEATALEAGDLLPDRLVALRIAPVLFQERTRGADIRAYVLDHQVVAAGELSTEATDFRTTRQAFRSTTLADDEAATAIAAAEVLALRFAGIDLKRPASGAAVLLDANPSPMFARFEDATGLSVAPSLALALATERGAG